MEGYSDNGGKDTIEHFFEFPSPQKLNKKRAVGWIYRWLFLD